MRLPHPAGFDSREQRGRACIGACRISSGAKIPRTKPVIPLFWSIAGFTAALASLERDLFCRTTDVDIGLTQLSRSSGEGSEEEFVATLSLRDGSAKVRGKSKW
jgi:hypothetical protein